MSQTVIVRQQRTAYTRARATNATDTSFPSRIPTVTEPTGTGVLNVGGADLLLVPFGTGNDDTTFSFRVIGWRAVDALDSRNRTLWVPVVLGEFSATLSTMVGVSGGIIDEANRFADTLSLVTGNEDVTELFTSPTGNVGAHAIVRNRGFDKVEITYDLTGATGANTLVALL